MDLTSLISTIITSTAALVAIIGGFLVSRVISISGEQNAEVKKLKEIQEKVRIQKKQQAIVSLTLDDIGKRLMEAELISLEEQENKHKQIIENNSKPEGVFSGLIVLFYACVVGIIYPSMLLPYPSEMYNDELTKRFLLFWFYSGLIVIFLYLFVQLKNLTKNL